MITELAAATAEVTKLIDDVLHRTQTDRLDAATQQALTDVHLFKDDLLARRLDAVNLRLDGLQHGILVTLTETERQQLIGSRAQLSDYALLGLYARARAADLAATCGQIYRVTASTDT